MEAAPKAPKTTMPQTPDLSPSQQQAYNEILTTVRSRTTHLIELRTPPSSGRGYGVTTVLRAAASALGVPLLGVSTVVMDTEQPTVEDAPLCALQAAALRSLAEHGVAIVDDLDLAVAPLSLRRSRTLIGELKGAGDVHNWEVAPAPAMLLKSLADAASLAGHVVLFSSLEDGHLSFIQNPLTITIQAPTVDDYTAVLNNLYNRMAGNDSAKVKESTEVVAKGLYALHSQLSPADLIAHAAKFSTQLKASNDLSGLLDIVRTELMSSSAISAQEVEAVDLATYPGMDEIKDELEKHVLFPIEDPQMATEMGLQPKRGVIIHGPPGTGKTTVGRWLAHRLKGKFFLVGEMMVHSDIIKVFAAAQAAAPAVVFIDDADIVIGGWRPLDGHRGSDIFRFLLGRMDGLTSRGKNQIGDVVVVLTAQRVQWMADMLLRSGRIELWIKTKLPNPKQKRAILTKYIQDDAATLDLLGVEGRVPDVRTAAQLSEDFCCADLRRIVNDAKIQAAWHRHQGGKAKNGAVYLEEAAKAVRDMQRDVNEMSRSIYS